MPHSPSQGRMVTPNLPRAAVSLPLPPTHSRDQGSSLWSSTFEEWPRHPPPRQGSLHQSPRAETSPLLGTNALRPLRASFLQEIGTALRLFPGPFRKEGQFDRSKVCVLGLGFVLF